MSEAGSGEGRRIRIIANPRAGGGKGAARAEYIAYGLRTYDVFADVRVTRYPGHAALLAAEALEEGLDAVAVHGGDGSLRDAAEALGGTDVPLLVLPGGTGNDFARTLGVPADPLAAAELLITGAPRAVDLWRWNERLFLNVAGLGFDGAVARRVNESRALSGFLRGSAAYLLGALTVLPRYEAARVEIATGEEARFRGAALLVAFANARCYGGGMRIAPEAELADGLLDVVVVRAGSKLEILRALPQVFRGAHLKHPLVQMFRAAELRVRCAGAPPVTLDGEVLGELPAEIRHAGRQLLVYAPKPPGDERVSG